MTVEKGKKGRPPGKEYPERLPGPRVQDGTKDRLGALRRHGRLESDIVRAGIMTEIARLEALDQQASGVIGTAPCSSSSTNEDILRRIQLILELDIPEVRERLVTRLAVIEEVAKRYVRGA